MEATLTLAHLLWMYDIRLHEDAASREPSGDGRVYAKHWGLRRRDPSSSRYKSPKMTSNLDHLSFNSNLFICQSFKSNSPSFNSSCSPFQTNVLPVISSSSPFR